MEETPLPRRPGDDVESLDLPVAPANDLNTDDRIVVATDYPTARGRAADPDRSVDATSSGEGVSASARATAFLVGWIQREPALAIGLALGLGFAVGFILRRTVFLSAWEVEGR